MSVYREQGREPDKREAPIEDDPLCVNCGHKRSQHYWFNSEFVDCGALGHYDESVVNGVLTKHQREATCKCQRFVRK